MRFYSSCI